MKYISLDPGMRTGYCESTDYGFSLSHRAVFSQNEMIQRLWGTADKEVIIIYEMFKIYAQKAQDMIMQELYAPESIGMIKAVAHLKGWEILAGQWASQAKTTIHDRMLVERGYILNSKNVEGIKDSAEVRHCKDAARHMLYYTDFTNK
jgi:hypothetical protein